MKPNIIVFPGSNCDRDIYVAIKKTTGQTSKMIWHKETSLDNPNLIILPGGFSHGDYLRSGSIASRAPIMKEVIKKALNGTPVLGICNGFQILTECELLPGILMRNKNMNFICKYTFLISKYENNWINKSHINKVISMPVAHHDGNYYANKDVIEKLNKDNRIAYQYCSDIGVGIFSAMWNEHCSYKSSKYWLKKLPTSGDRVVQGPGENAGVIDIDDGDVAVFKMESHNHPSFIEPYQGAATGVGGILRDVFTMGARPVANLNALRFGEIDHPKTKHLLSGVVEGIGGYGNCIGIPTVGGEVNFHPSYNGNILVNAMTVGIAKKDKIFYSAAAGIGNPVVYVGSKTGRDGIHGATMASAEFDDDSEDKKPTVQVGDPFTEKLLLEACLELMETDCIIGIQDMGAAGLTSSSMAAKDNNGIEIDLDKVPVRETKMTPFEIMLSESQERMLMVLKPGSEEKAEEIFKKWELDFSIIGKVTSTQHIVLKHNTKTVADIPLEPLANGLIYDRPYKINLNNKSIDIPVNDNWENALLTLIENHDLCSREWIWQQYDHMVMGDTIGMPGSESGVVKIHNIDKQALAITTDCTPRYCDSNAHTGGMQAVCESYRNLCSVGSSSFSNY
jgi:phosphoribosylformylglycinamidine synthase